MPLDLTPSTAELCQRADDACSTAKRLVQETIAQMAKADMAFRRLEAGTLAIDWRAANAWRDRLPSAKKAAIPCPDANPGSSGWVHSAFRRAPLRRS